MNRRRVAAEKVVLFGMHYNLIIVIPAVSGIQKAAENSAGIFDSWMPTFVSMTNLICLF